MRNKMLDQPILDLKVQKYLRQQPLPISTSLAQIEQQARAKRIPIIPRETAVYLFQLVCQLKPRRILEVGSAIGFSAALFVEASQKKAQVTTIDRFPHFYHQAQKNWQELDLEEQIKFIAGDAAEVLPQLTGSYDLIFLDAAKAQYIRYLPEVLRLVAADGLILMDDVLQGGSVFAPDEAIRHRNKGIHRRLNDLLTQVYQDPQLLVSLLPLGDGLLQIMLVHK